MSASDRPRTAREPSATTPDRGATPSPLAPRGFLSTAVHFGATSGLLLAPFYAGSMVVFLGDSPAKALPRALAHGALFAVLFGPTMGCFFRGETTTVEVADQASFAARLDVALAQLGYRLARRAGDVCEYRPGLRAGLDAGRVAVQVGDREAVIVGPRYYVRRLARRLASG